MPNTVKIAPMEEGINANDQVAITTEVSDVDLVKTDKKESSATMDIEKGKGSLLPSILRPSANHGPERSDSSFLFKAYVILSMTIVWTGYTLTVKYTRSMKAPEDMYSSTTVVLCAELTKMLISIVMLAHYANFRLDEFKHVLFKHFFNQPKELLKMSVPSIAYALQNNLDFVALSHLDPGVYQVTTQLKVVTTALFMVAFLGRRFSRTRWAAIFLLFVGVALVQLNAALAAPSSSSSSSNSSSPAVAGGHKEDYVIGIAAVLATCVTAGFAGVYFERMLKDGGVTPFWIRNLQMYFCGVISASCGMLVAESGDVFEKGFFHGYDGLVVAIIGLLSVGGVYISLVMKHLDNLHKSFASAVSILLVVVLSFFIFANVSIGAFFVAGAATVCGAILLYNSVPE